ncbi:MAG: hypothetical protein IJX98_00175 [Clostridia bacterium]|nr:hypothetical protein [Clostridia bacterium]
MRNKIFKFLAVMFVGCFLAFGLIACDVPSGNENESETNTEQSGDHDENETGSAGEDEIVVKRTVTAEEWTAAFDDSRFYNVTLTGLGFYGTEIDYKYAFTAEKEGNMLLGQKTEENNFQMYLTYEEAVEKGCVNIVANMRSVFEEYGNYAYEEEQEEYIYQISETQYYTVQFADGYIVRLGIFTSSRSEIVNLSNYGTTVVPAHTHELEAVSRNEYCIPNGIDFNGTARYECKTCEYFKREELPLTGHNFASGVCTLCGQDESLKRTVTAEEWEIALSENELDYDYENFTYVEEYEMYLWYTSDGGYVALRFANGELTGYGIRRANGGGSWTGSSIGDDSDDSDGSISIGI